MLSKHVQKMPICVVCIVLTALRRFSHSGCFTRFMWTVLRDYSRATSTDCELAQNISTNVYSAAKLRHALPRVIEWPSQSLKSCLGIVVLHRSRSGPLWDVRQSRLDWRQSPPLDAGQRSGSASVPFQIDVKPSSRRPTGSSVHT